MPKSRKSLKEKESALAPLPDAASVVKSTAEELLRHLQIGGTVAVRLQKETETDERGAVYEVTIETEETGLLIGFHGETLSSFQLILGLILYKRLGVWTRVIVNVGDYRQKRAEVLTAMANSYAAQALAQNQAISFPPLPPSERRIIHLVLQDNPDVASESVGEGRDRRVVVKPKTSPVL